MKSISLSTLCCLFSLSVIAQSGKVYSELNLPSKLFATPMIIVMPDANTGRQGYFDDIKGDWPYKSFSFNEFRIQDSGHTWSYWRNSPPHVLTFVSKGFHQY